MRKIKNIFVITFVVYFLVFVYACGTFDDLKNIDDLTDTSKYSLGNDEVILKITTIPEGTWYANGASERYVSVELVDNVEELSIAVKPGSEKGGLLFYLNQPATSEIKLANTNTFQIGKTVNVIWRSSTKACDICGSLEVNATFKGHKYSRVQFYPWTVALPEYLGVAVSPNPINSPQNEATFTVTAYDALGGFASDNTKIIPEAIPAGGTSGFWNSNIINIVSGTGTGVWHIDTFPSTTSTVVLKATYPETTMEASLNLVVVP